MPLKLIGGEIERIIENPRDWAGAYAGSGRPGVAASSALRV